MKPTLTLLFGLLLSGCESIPPIDISLEASVLDIVKVKPSFTIGDGVVGPTDVQVEAIEEDPDAVH